MKNVLAVMISVAVLILIGMNGTSPRTSFVGAEETQNFTHVDTFITTGGYVGFFDKKDGKVYLYDGDLKNCVQISQVKKLGEAMNVIKPLATAVPVIKYQ